MSLSIGIVGLPNVGKSTLFNALTRSTQAQAQNYPFCTIDPNVGIVDVPDARIDELARISKSAKKVPAAVEFVDIAGLVKGASEGEGLGNKFLSHIREVDAIIQVVRAFSDPNVIHVQNRVDPREDAAIINLELVLADMQSVASRLDKTKKAAKGIAAKDKEKELMLLERLYATLEAGKRASTLSFDEDETVIMKELHLLTMKPLLYVVNTDEAAGAVQMQIEEGVDQIEISARLEAELAELTEEEARQYLADLGMKETGLDKLVVASYRLLNLITFFTSGEPETRAWTVGRGATAPLAAGVIHTDFIKGFIKADVVKCADFIAVNGWGGARDNGKLRTEGKEYVVQDGDVCYFHVNT